MARYVEVIAEKGYLDTVRNTRIVAKAVLGEDTITVVMIKDAGRSYYVKSRFRDQEEVKVYHNGAAATIINGRVERITDKAELDDLKLHSHILPDAVYKKLGYKMTLEGVSKLDGVEYNVVKLQSPNGYVATNYYEKESGLLRIIKGKEGIKVELTEYTRVKGMLYNRRNLMTFPEGGTLELVLHDVVNNEKLDPSLFKF